MPDRVVAVVDDVRRYYDVNTERFERFGQGHHTGSIHRAVAPAPSDTERDPLRTLDRLVLAELEGLRDRFVPPFHVLDLGCGVGATLLYLAEHLPIVATGVTLSSVQARRARERVQARGRADRVRVLERSYLDLPSDLAPAALAYSIEAFIHGPDPAAFFASAAAHVAPGGLLVVCDDFLGERARDASKRDERTLREYREGWLANSLVSVARASDLAAAAGFRLEKNLDLGARLELGRPRDHLIALFVAFARLVPKRGYFLRSLVGGNALQQALRRGLLEFRCVVWRRAHTGDRLHGP
jgi:SAM-dependent methyltransferase